MRRASWLTALALVGACLGASRAHAYCRMTTSLRAPSITEPCILPNMDADPPEHFLAWQRACTSITLSATNASADLTESEVLGVLERSIATWESVTCGGAPVGLDVQVLQDLSTCGRPLYRDSGGNVSTIMFVADWTERMNDPAAFALTTVWHRKSTGEILDADMEINELRGPYAICPPAGCTEDRGVDLENVVTHEMGHYFGLAHSTNMDSTMFASAVAGETIKRDLDADDVMGLCEVYPAGSLPAECDYTPRGGLDLTCNTGCSVRAPGAPERGPLLVVVAALALVLSRRRPG
ncbi:MAG: matrixin family metalloprotease [Sandaracinaceae bacterium]